MAIYIDYYEVFLSIILFDLTGQLKAIVLFQKCSYKCMTVGSCQCCIPSLLSTRPEVPIPAATDSELGQGMLTLILEGEVSVRLTSLYLLVRSQLFQENLRIYFSFSKQPSPNW